MYQMQRHLSVAYLGALRFLKSCRIAEVVCLGVDAIMNKKLEINNITSPDYSHLCYISLRSHLRVTAYTIRRYSNRHK